MSAITPTAEDVAQRLENRQLSWWSFTLGAGLALVIGISLGMLFLFVLADALLCLSQPVLGVLFAAWMLLTLAALSGLCVILRRGQRTLEATARRIEMEAPELGSHLINLVQFSEEAEGASDSFRRAALNQAAAAVGDFPFHAIARRQGRRQRLALCLLTPRDLAEACGAVVLVLVLGLLGSLALPSWSSSLSRLLHPWKFVPSVGSVHIVAVTPGDADVLLGSALEIAAEIDNPAHRRYRATLHLRLPGDKEQLVEMAADEAGRRFAVTLPQVAGPLDYFLQVDDSQSRLFHLSTRQKPAIARVEVKYLFPAYLGRAAETISQAHGDLEAPQFTVAELDFYPVTPIARGFLEVEGRRIGGAVLDEGQRFRVALLLRSNTTYTVHLFTDADQTDREPRVNQVRVLPDTPPTVQLLQPTAETAAVPGSALAFVVRATDDHGLGQVRLEMKRGGEPETIFTWTRFADDTNALLHHTLTLDRARFKPGEPLLVRAVALDRRDLDTRASGQPVHLGPQESATPWLGLKLTAPEVRAAADLAQLDSLRAALLKILAQQVSARNMAAGIPRQKTPGEASRLAGEVQGQQAAIQKATAAVVELAGKTDDPHRQALKHAAAKLALGDMLPAIRQAAVLQQVRKVEDLARPAQTLMATQDRILDVLRRMLYEARRDTAEVLAPMKERPGTELPPDVKQKLRELRDKLAEFLAQQKKVIEASEDLAKMPVEDFTDKQEQQLAALAQAEEDWSRFLAERHSDLSKLPEQDFSNPSLLQEMIAVQTELKMARDALLKKAADIAVPLEQLGAEMAKELTTNIEKWLPDTPDRERWSQEEPLTDAMKEAPMAELPRELEDLVGKLMEEEEDLLDEVEDVSSSWADSIDKGAGWDAADGPISNMSAKGVTGNRLPNTNEIGGRSGEGRQGKSSGEFVGDTAVGKGGRKTPSRLTPEPHVKGQVKDKNKDPTGGATGGGKESGQGGQGLHGPVPDRPERQMQRLADKQAELRNKAESVDPRFRVLRHHHADLQKMVEQMKGVENDLRSGRYQNALRRREVLLEGLTQLRSALQGESAIRRDLTPNLPADIQKEILGSMQEGSPPGWEQLNRQYFERLGSSPAPDKRK
jgi:hypothetical protein